MRFYKKKFILFFLCLSAAKSYAAQPTSVKMIEDIIMADDSIYTYYVVKCSNGAKVDVSSWGGNKLWCLGKGIKNECKKKQIKIAKKACKNA
ncbi:MAG: hypothetical protein COA42_13425 [Alteromonadaceae bacterium]|nr:MAG: hypothetical protein COA42_13425 [Alteromonadaceae bacterium]